MKVSEIQDAMEGAIVARGCFIVGINISKDNDIELAVESENGTVELEDCVELSRIFEEKFSRDTEDYSLTVTSAGLDQPFKVWKQYVKAVGQKVEAAVKGGKKIIAVLSKAEEGSITLDYTTLEKTEGSKRKTPVSHSDTIPLSDINYVRYYIDFNQENKNDR